MEVSIMMLYSVNYTTQKKKKIISGNKFYDIINWNVFLKIYVILQNVREMF